MTQHYHRSLSHTECTMCFPYHWFQLLVSEWLANNCFQTSLWYVTLNKASAPCQVFLRHQMTHSNSWPLPRCYYSVVSSMKSLGSTPNYAADSNTQHRGTVELEQAHCI